MTIKEAFEVGVATEDTVVFLNKNTASALSVLGSTNSGNAVAKL